MSYEQWYVHADRTMVFNDDDPCPDLKPITYELPFDEPEWSLIDGFGLDPKDMYWRRKPLPQKLKELDDRTDLTDNQKKEFIVDNKVHYRNEIEYIRNEQERRRNGHWIFIGTMIDGFRYAKPYWMPPDFYFYLQWWMLDDNTYGIFRMRDLKHYTFEYMTDHDPLCTGYNYPKYRREFATTKISAKRYNDATKYQNYMTDLQSKDDDHASEVMQEHVLSAFKRLPFFLRPIWNQKSNVISEIRFDAPTAKDHPDYGKRSLHSFIKYSPSGVFALDGKKRHYIHSDEIGKTTTCNVKTRLEVQLPCIFKGSRIIMADPSNPKNTQHAKIVNTSTVADMDKFGGRHFKDICDDSFYHNRNKNGRTKFGLYNLFISSWDGYIIDQRDVAMILKQLGRNEPATSYPDKYGYCDKDVCYTFMKNKRDELLQSGDLEGYLNECRQFPLIWEDCWKESAVSNNFDVVILQTRISELKEMKVNPSVRRGDFEWQNGVRDSRVVFVDNPNGHFELSLTLPDDESNRYYMRDGVRWPASTTRFVAGGDPFGFKTTKGNKKSKGAGAVYWMQDSSVDNLNGSIDDWKSDRFVCTYLYRPPEKITYAEDMLKMCVYFGCEMNTETQIQLLIDHFEERGYDNYLYYNLNKTTNREEKTAGTSASTKTFEEICREYQFYIKRRGYHEVHLELLEQCYEINDDMGDYDLFAAGGYALIAAKRFINLRQVTADENIAEDFGVNWDEYEIDEKGNTTPAY